MTLLVLYVVLLPLYVIKFVSIQKKPRLKKVKLLDSDDDEEDQGAENSATTEREAIANELFEGTEDTAEVTISVYQQGKEAYVEMNKDS